MRSRILHVALSLDSQAKKQAMRTLIIRIEKMEVCLLVLWEIVGGRGI